MQHGPADATSLICDLLGVDPSADVRAALLRSFDEVGREAPLRLAPNAEECIRRLKDAGVRIGIVCDVGMTASPTLRERLDMFGVLRYFDHWSFSDEVGCFKPWPAVFEHALSGLGVDDPSGAAHVGDSRRTDVAGAQAMGMTTVRYTYFVDARARDRTRGPPRARRPRQARVRARYLLSVSRRRAFVRCSGDDG